MNKPIKSLLDCCRGIGRKALLCAVVAWSVSGSLAWAKGAKPVKEAPQEKEYLLPYVVTVFGIALGLMTVCRPGRRLDQPRRTIDQGE
jgi:hypothetical protein